MENNEKKERALEREAIPFSIKHPIKIECQSVSSEIESPWVIVYKSKIKTITWKTKLARNIDGLN